MPKNAAKIPYVLFITGPTGSGKTDFSLKLAQRLCGEIINADVGQFYQPLNVGTAKPAFTFDYARLTLDGQNQPIKHHLFDVIAEPENCNVVAYRDMLLQKIDQIHHAGKQPIVVGGSLFYLQSIFFIPEQGCAQKRLPDEGGPRRVVTCSDENLWEKVHQVDPERARAINHSDTYRITRALEIWQTTGKKPSEVAPKFAPQFNARILFINLPRGELCARINQRTEQMIEKEGWIDEVKGLSGTPWESFLCQKKLIGYPEIFAFLHRGKRVKELPALIAIIQQKTRQYAKRQVTFWKKFRTLLECESKTSGYRCMTSVITDTTEATIKTMCDMVADEQKNRR